MKPQVDRWSRCARKPEKVIREIRRACDEKQIPLEERQKGSHWVGSASKGSVVVPVHGEIPKGTWASILKMLTNLGIAAFILCAILILCLIF